jgi:hypothetical protein
LVGADAGCDVRTDHIEDFGRQAPGFAHSGNVRRGLKAHSILVSRREGVRRARAEMLGSARGFRNKIRSSRLFRGGLHCAVGDSDPVDPAKGVGDR